MGIKYIIAALLFTSCNVSSKVLEKYELMNSKYNPYAINVIKIARMHPKMKDWDIEVELKY